MLDTRVTVLSFLRGERAPGRRKNSKVATAWKPASAQTIFWLVKWSEPKFSFGVCNLVWCLLLLNRSFLGEIKWKRDPQLNFPVRFPTTNFTILCKSREPFAVIRTKRVFEGLLKGEKNAQAYHGAIVTVRKRHAGGVGQNWHLMAAFGSTLHKFSTHISSKNHSILFFPLPLHKRPQNGPEKKKVHCQKSALVLSATSRGSSSQ